MKITAELFDVVLIVLLLGMMLPFIFGAVSPLMDREAWGFGATDDKTMKRHGGDVLTLGELYADDSLTAAEVVLLTRVHDRDTVSPNRYRLPDGTVILVDGGYRAAMNDATAKARAALDPAYRYRVVYDYEAGLWNISRIGGDTP
jgi:hypothetical protein